MIVFEHTKHKVLWNRVAEILKGKPDKWLSEIKIQAFDELFPNETMPENTCYACEYDEEICDMFTEENRPVICENCPLIWPGWHKSCEENYDDSGNLEFGLHAELMYAISGNRWDDAVKLAEQIRDLPIKNDVETV